MKKKFLIAVLIIVVVFWVGYITIKSDQTTKNIDKEWTISSDVLNSIQLLGAEQDVNVTLIEAENEKTKVKLSGKVSNKVEKELSHVKVEPDRLKITLSDLEGFKLMPNNDGKSKLDLYIYLEKGKNIKKLKIDSIVGNVYITVPKNFQGSYVTSVKNGGEVLSVPDTSNEQNSEIEVSTIGDIQIKK